MTAKTPAFNPIPSASVTTVAAESHGCLPMTRRAWRRSWRTRAGMTRHTTAAPPKFGLPRIAPNTSGPSPVRRWSRAIQR